MNIGFGLFNQAMTGGLDSLDAASLQATMLLACKLVSAKVVAPVSSGESANRPREEAKETKEPKETDETKPKKARPSNSGGKQQSLKEMFSKNNGW